MASWSNRYTSGLRKPHSSAPPGRSTRKHSRHTGASSGTNRFETGLKTRSNEESPNSDRSRMSPSTVRSSRPLALRDHLILGELTRRVVQDRDPRAGRGERRTLLPPARGQAENVYIGQVGGEPRPVDRPVPDEYDGPVTGACPRDG